MTSSFLCLPTTFNAAYFVRKPILIDKKDDHGAEAPVNTTMNKQTSGCGVKSNAAWCQSHTTEIQKTNTTKY